MPRLFSPASVLAIMQTRYPTYNSLPRGERVLLAMAYLCDDIKPRETQGPNRSPAVDAIILGNGGTLGDSWCAHSIGFCCKVASVTAPAGSGAVGEWRDWADANGKLRGVPQRGFLCFRKHTGASHIGIVKAAGPDDVWSIEGNTSAGLQGSQQNGDGMFRRQRSIDFWDGFIEL